MKINSAEKIIRALDPLYFASGFLTQPAKGSL